MNKKRKNILIVLVCIVLALGTGVFFFGKKFVEKKIIKTIEMTWNNSETEDEPEFLKEITKKSSYEIVSIEDGDIYTVNVVVKGIDVGEKLKNLTYEDFAKVESEKEWDGYMREIIEACEIIETPAAIYAEKTKDGYEISFTDTFVDAMSGKIYSYYMDIVNETLEK